MKKVMLLLLAMMCQGFCGEEKKSVPTVKLAQSGQTISDSLRLFAAAFDFEFIFREQKEMDLIAVSFEVQGTTKDNFLQKVEAELEEQGLQLNKLGKGSYEITRVKSEEELLALKPPGWAGLHYQRSEPRFRRVPAPGEKIDPDREAADRERERRVRFEPRK